jgi:hypothetical protein
MANKYESSANDKGADKRMSKAATASAMKGKKKAAMNKPKGKK